MLLQHSDTRPQKDPNVSSHLTLFLLTTDSTTQYELHQLAQFSDVSHLPDKVHVWHVHIRYLVVEHLFMEGRRKMSRRIPAASQITLRRQLSPLSSLILPSHVSLNQEGSLLMRAQHNSSDDTSPHMKIHRGPQGNEAPVLPFR
ncbi:hypothetical protein EYF80_044485 [Liparis tanakae]|uniref:Uncharacterized protein n=1 Tax=Liparis tanakae TaxID=230148 RepID=A0A4Z2FWL3_9TELE|nr:hypothetical protein EYF80_044485 [Liparis tanakae]